MESIHDSQNKPAVPTEEKSMSNSKLNRKPTAGFQPKINRIYTRAPSPVLIGSHPPPPVSFTSTAINVSAPSVATSSGSISRVRVRAIGNRLYSVVNKEHMYASMISIDM